MKYKVIITFEVEAQDYDEACDKISDITWRIDNPKDIEIEEV